METRVVDNRVFLLGLDELYREAMKTYERTELLEAAQATANTLSVAPADVPIEGYYGEEEKLTQYFRLMRALQQVSKDREPELKNHPGFDRLKQVTSSRLFGVAASGSSILPAGKDSLSLALEATFPNWNIATVTEQAYEVAVSSGDYSLVALAALSRDAVVLTALRESVVLYAALMAGAAFMEEPKYVWEVDDLITARATLFVEEFNNLFNEQLPEPKAENAAWFWGANKRSDVLGRCVRIGYDDSVQPVRYYHWAVKYGQGYSLTAEDFWDTEVWTTERYRADKYNE
ncbi:MAG: hypothetical protein AAFX87_22155 [Bacteroidota bacterium]